jgi:hypothetical protein
LRAVLNMTAAANSSVRFALATRRNRTADSFKTDSFSKIIFGVCVMEKIAKRFDEYLRTNGIGAARQLIAAHGGRGADYETVPPENLTAFARDLGLTVADHAELTGRNRDLPESLSTSDPKFQSLHDKAWNRFNGGRHA